MQHASVYLYSNKIDVFINPIDSFLSETYHNVYTRNLKIYRSVDNTIEIRVKNSDQRAANINNDMYLVFTLTTHENQQLILKKDCYIKDRSLGIASVTITKEQMLKIEKGYYRYSIVQEKREPIESGSDEYVVVRTLPTYVDTAYDMIGEVEVAGDVIGSAIPSVTINKFSYVNPIGLGEEEPVFYTSSIVDANPFTTDPQTMHTFQFYFGDTYEGEVVIQASIEEQGATPGHGSWIDVESFETYDEAAYKDYVTITGKYNWFRIKHYPVTDDITGVALGKIDKILYR